MPAASAPFPPLASIVPHAFIVAYKEDTAPLEAALRAEGFTPVVLRPSYTPDELTYSRAIRCLLNHGNAWRQASALPGLSLVVEADFVPCRGFGRLPLPFDPVAQGARAWAFLYSSAPRIFERLPDGSLLGHSSTPVAYAITPQVAAWLSDYLREELPRHGDLTQYSLWDTQFQWHIMGKGGRCFIPFRSFGEHGGLPNAEHHREGVGLGARLRFLARAGFGANHYADSLAAPLRFLPAYALGRRGKFLRTRLEAKLIGLLKLFAGRIAGELVRVPLGARLRLRLTCLARLCSPY